MKLWGGRFSKEAHSDLKSFSSSIKVDEKLWDVDLKASMAHVRMLGEQRVLALEDSDAILRGLHQIHEELSTEAWSFDASAEDIHGEIERRLFELIGEPAKKMHTARSRNDQVATDTRLYLNEQIQHLCAKLRVMQNELLRLAELHVHSVMPGTTHLQPAQPVSLAHHLLAYFWMFERDHQRLQESLPRVMSMPLGSAALAGTSFPIDRESTARELGFFKVSENSMDAVSDRDFVIEFLSHASILMMHLSRMAEEWILWNSKQYGFIDLGDDVTTGSSIMPQKKNPDIAELVRGRVGRVYGALMGALTMMKALPLSYNRDMQEDKVHLFEGLETTLSCLELTTLMLTKTEWKTERMKNTLRGDFSNATDLADDLVKKGLSFREAHEVVGHVVQYCIQEGKALEDLDLGELNRFSKMFDDSSLLGLAHQKAMEARTSSGGTSPQSVLVQIQQAKRSLQPVSL